MRIAVVVGILFPEHHQAGAVKKLGSCIGKRAIRLRDLAEQAQGQGISVKGLYPPVCKVVQETICIDIWKFLRKKGARIVTREGLQVKQHRGHAIIILDPDAICGTQPICFSAGENKKRVAHL